MTLSTRGHRGRDHVLITPENRYASRLAHLPEAQAFKLVSPRLAPAAFAQTLLRLPDTTQPGGRWPRERQHFIFGLSGQSRWQLDETSLTLEPGDFFYAGPDVPVTLTATAPDTALLHLHRPRLDAIEPPEVHRGRLSDCPGRPTGVDGLERHELLPTDDPSFDFAMSVMRFEPHASLGQVEIHDEEHGLYMLSGDGCYLLGESWYEVRAEDFIYMAPYCPQSFIAGERGAAYLLYKDAWRELS